MKSAVAALFTVLGLTNIAQAQQSFGFVDPRIIDRGNSIGSQLMNQPVDPETTYLKTRGFAGRGDDGVAGYSDEYIRLSDVLRAAGASGGVTQYQLNAAISAQGAQLSTTLTGIANRLDRITDRFREGVALAGSINVLPPNPGDRFAVSFGGADYEGAGAGSVAISARLREDIIAYGAVARGPTQTLVKGGVGFSFK